MHCREASPFLQAFPKALASKVCPSCTRKICPNNRLHRMRRRHKARADNNDHFRHMPSLNRILCFHKARALKPLRMFPRDPRIAPIAFPMHCIPFPPRKVTLRHVDNRRHTCHPCRFHRVANKARLHTLGLRLRCLLDRPIPMTMTPTMTPKCPFLPYNLRRLRWRNSTNSFVSTWFLLITYPTMKP